jgi:hypothetical protein
LYCSHGIPHMIWWFIALGCLIVALAGLWRPVRALSREARLAKAKKFFHTQRERLEAKFIHLASKRAKSDARRCSDCTFADDVSYVRNRATGELSAFVEISIPAENAISELHKTGDAVGNLQLGTAVFRYDRDHWETDGRAILNLSPAEAIKHFRQEIEKVGEESAHPS